MNRVPILFLCLLLILPISVLGDCTCESETGDENKSEALKYKLAAIAPILTASAIGVSLPILGKAFVENDVFFVIKAFAAGVILATGFIHVLPDAFSDLTSPCLAGTPFGGDFPVTGLVAMLAAIGTMMVDAFATSYYTRTHFVKARPVNGDEESHHGGEHEGHVHVHTHATHGHAHGSGLGLQDEVDSGSSELLRHRIISQVLELGIVVHSVIIGISLGASQTPKTIKPLVAALTFHQFFEGMGLGGCISQAKFKARATTVMAIFFSLTTPVGIAIGFGISNIYDENSPSSLIVEGIFNSASAGILIYMALVDLLAADFMNPRMQSNLKLQLSSNLSLLIGAGFMSILAKWA